jgi:hypothetical protein
MFLFSCFTGLAYTDICNLTEKQIVKAPDGVLWIRTNRQKTGVSCNIPLLDIPVQIIKNTGEGQETENCCHGKQQFAE